MLSMRQLKAGAGTAKIFDEEKIMVDKLSGFMLLYRTVG